MVYTIFLTDVTVGLISDVAKPSDYLWPTVEVSRTTILFMIFGFDIFDGR
jgi:hypothetical protein